MSFTGNVMVHADEGPIARSCGARWQDVPDVNDALLVDVPLAEVNTPRVRYWLGGGRSGKRRSLPSADALRWFLNDNRYGLDDKGRVVATLNGRAYVVAAQDLRRAWEKWARTHAWRRVGNDIDDEERR